VYQEQRVFQALRALSPAEVLQAPQAPQARELQVTLVRLVLLEVLVPVLKLSRNKRLGTLECLRLNKRRFALPAIQVLVVVFNVPVAGTLVLGLFQVLMLLQLTVRVITL